MSIPSTPSFLLNCPVAMHGSVDMIALDFGRLAPDPPRPPQMRIVGGVAVVQVTGLLTPFPSGYRGTIAASHVRRMFHSAHADPSVRVILFDIDSPGGPVEGLPEIADEIRASTKPTVAVANCLAAGTSYMLAAQCGEVCITPSGEAGGIGVMVIHVDHSAELEKAGIDITLISSAPYKTDGNPFQPLSDSAREHMQRRVDETGRLFFAAVAAGRRIPIETVHERFGGGRVYGAAESVRRGLADRVATRDEVVDGLVSQRSARIKRFRQSFSD